MASGSGAFRTDPGAGCPGPGVCHVGSLPETDIVAPHRHGGLHSRGHWVWWRLEASEDSGTGIRTFRLDR